MKEDKKKLEEVMVRRSRVKREKSEIDVEKNQVMQYYRRKIMTLSLFLEWKKATDI